MKNKEKATIKLGNKMYTRKAVRRYERAFIAIGAVATLIGLFFASISIGFLIFTLLITAFTFFIAYAYHTAIKADIKKENEASKNKEQPVTIKCSTQPTLRPYDTFADVKVDENNLDFEQNLASNISSIMTDENTDSDGLSDSIEATNSDKTIDSVDTSSSDETTDSVEAPSSDKISDVQPTETKPNYRYETFYVAGTSRRQDAILSLPHIENELYRSSSVKRYEREGYFWDDKVYQYDFKEYTLLLNIEHEPDNPADPNAMKVCINDIHVGYIKKDDLDRFDEVANAQPKGVVIDILGGKYKYVTMNDYGEEIIASGKETFYIKLIFRL